MIWYRRFICLGLIRALINECFTTPKGDLQAWKFSPINGDTIHSDVLPTLLTDNYARWNAPQSPFRVAIATLKNWTAKATYNCEDKPHAPALANSPSELVDPLYMRRFGGFSIRIVRGLMRLHSMAAYLLRCKTPR